MENTKRRNCRAACLLALLSGLIVCASIIATRYLERTALAHELEYQRSATLSAASHFRTRIEAEVNSTFYLITGLLGSIQSNPNLSQEQFSDIVAPMLNSKPTLLNIAAAPDLVIKYIYPLEENRSALGLKYLKLPEQAEAAQRVIESGQPVLAGPIELVQGGQAFVGRFPVYIRTGSNRKSWGLIATPVDMNSFYRSCGLLEPNLEIKIALRGKDGLGHEGETFFGDSQLFSGNNIKLPIKLLSGYWELAASPREGWLATAPNQLTIRVSTSLITLLALALLGLLYTHIKEIERSREKEMQANQAKSRFLANISHDIRSPLNGILGITKLLKETETNNKRNEWLSTMIRSGKSLMNLLDDILDLSKIEAGRLTINLSAIKLKPFLDDIFASLTIDAKERNLRIYCNQLPAELDIIYADETRLRQILWNLFANALKFTNEGEITLDIDFANKDKKQIHFIVSDTGIGIPPDRLESVFEEFEQGNASISLEYGGTGLGLSIARRLATELGGSLTAASELGKGSDFTLTLNADPTKSDR